MNINGIKPVCVIAAAGMFVSLSIPAKGDLITDNLLVHLRADQGVIPQDANGAFVWHDQATLGGNQNFATATSGRLPSLVSNATLAAGPAIRFDGDDWLNDSNDPNYDTNNLSWFLVFKADDATSAGFLVESTYSSVSRAWATYMTGGNLFSGARDSGGTLHASNHDTSTDWLLLSTVWNGDTGDVVTIVTNLSTGVSISNGATGATSDPTGHVLTRLGAYTGSDYFFKGDMAEVLIYTSSLSDADRASVSEYLTSRFVPEPAGSALLVLGAALAMVPRRSRRRASGV